MYAQKSQPARKFPFSGGKSPPYAPYLDYWIRFSPRNLVWQPRKGSHATLGQTINHYRLYISGTFNFIYTTLDPTFT